LNADEIAALLEAVEKNVARWHWFSAGCRGSDCIPMCRLAALVREQQARIEGLTKWRPMETAPHDRPILAAWFDETGDCSYEVLRWDGRDTEAPWASLTDDALSWPAGHFTRWLPIPGEGEM
jgi:hypothetical protein